MVIKARKEDIDNIVKLALLLWEDSKKEELKQNFLQLFNNDDFAVFLAKNESIIIGFAQVQLRNDYVEGTNSSPVGYLEGIFVKDKYRHCGYAKQLLSECEKWAKLKGCTEFASDCELTNNASLEFHKKLGFVEANRIICFTKKL